MKEPLPYWYRPPPSAVWRWMLYASKPDVRCLRRWLFWVWWSRPRTLRQRLGAMWDLAVRPLTCGKAVLSTVAVYGDRVRRIHGIGMPRQILDVLGLGFGAGLDPVTYYQYQLFLPSRRARRREYLDVSGKLLQVLAQRLPKGPDDGIFTDKAVFAAWCRSWGLPVVGDHALIDPMAADSKSGFIPFPAEDLVVKPINWRAGEGISLWRCSLQGNEPVWEDGNGGKRLDARALWAHLQQSAVAMRRPLLVQPRLVNHPAIRELGNGCLCSVRVMTVREGGQRPQVIATALRIPMGQRAADNFDQGGLGVGVDPRTGRCGRAVQKTGEYPLPLLECNPHTGVVIEGQVLPHWRATLDLALTAHERVRSVLPIIGWDVAILADGPVFLEANHLPGEHIVQIPSGIPLGATPYPDVLCRSLRRAFAEPED